MYEVAELNTRVDLIGEKKIELRLKGNKGMNYVCIWSKGIPHTEVLGSELPKHAEGCKFI